VLKIGLLMQLNPPQSSLGEAVEEYVSDHQSNPVPKFGVTEPEIKKTL